MDDQGVYRTSIATSSDRDEIIGFLEKQGVLENAWLIWDVSDSFAGRKDPESLVVCRSRTDVVGVAYICQATEDRSGCKPSYDYDARLDAVDREAAEALLAGLPKGQSVYFTLVFRPVVQEYLGNLPGCTRHDGDLYFTVTPDRFQPVPSEDVVELTAADAGLFEGCEKQPAWESMRDNSRMFAIVRDGRAASSVSCGPFPPKFVTSPRVFTVAALHTETPYRRMGLARKVVSHATDIILRDGGVPMYWTEQDNMASQELCKCLGYWQYARQARFLWRKT